MEKIVLYLAIVIITFISCTPSQKARDAKENALFNKWLNKPKALLIKNWGQPDSTITDKRGGEILIYKEGVDYKSVMNEKYTGTQFSYRREMYVNADSLIYYWKSWRRK
ncbi:MAG: hypothetical protein M3004_05755 [Bacteroidota bacterium]|nr:hypothetical protein [Bacteroidota bacterium]